MFLADGVLFFVAFLWGTSFVAMKGAVAGIPPFYLVGVVVLGEIFTLPMVFGGLCIFAGVLLCEMGPFWAPFRRAVSRR